MYEWIVNFSSSKEITLKLWIFFSIDHAWFAWLMSSINLTFNFFKFTINLNFLLWVLLQIKRVFKSRANASIFYFPTFNFSCKMQSILIFFLVYQSTHHKSGPFLSNFLKFCERLSTYYSPHYCRVVFARSLEMNSICFESMVTTSFNALAFNSSRAPGHRNALFGGQKFMPVSLLWESCVGVI